MEAHTAELTLEALKDAVTMWIEEVQPDCCEVDELITHIEATENYPESDMPITTIDSDYKYWSPGPDMNTNETGTQEIRHTTKTLAAKHFQMAMKMKPHEDWYYDTFWDIAVEMGEYPVDQNAALRLIAMLLNVLEDQHVGR